MKIDYLYRHKEFKKVLEKELDRLIKGEINQIRIKNIPLDVFCEATGCETNDFNGWQFDWWGDFEYKGYKFDVMGSAWYGTVNVSLKGYSCE